MKNPKAAQKLKERQEMIQKKQALLKKIEQELTQLRSKMDAHFESMNKAIEKK
ncbi:hypothetical protein [Salmonirosea aquatica]|uniref:hypothetical protein n=1 Tax=Salmonirosea aquatica TaxID=2654236 RepID=UPI0035716D5B